MSKSVFSIKQTEKRAQRLWQKMCGNYGVIVRTKSQTERHGPAPKFVCLPSEESMFSYKTEDSFSLTINKWSRIFGINKRVNVCSRSFLTIREAF